VGNGFSSRAPPSARLSRWARELRQVSARCLSGAPGPFAPISAASVPAVAAGSYALGPGWHGALPTSCRLCQCLASHRLQQRRVAGHASTAMLDPAAHTRCKRLEVSCPTDTFARHAPSAKIAALCPSRSGGRVAPYCGFMDMVDPHVLNGGSPSMPRVPATPWVTVSGHNHGEFRGRRRPSIPIVDVANVRHVHRGGRHATTAAGSRRVSLLR